MSSSDLAQNEAIMRLIKYINGKWGNLISTFLK